MPLVCAGIVPHTPLLLPTIGKEYHAQSRKTQRALTLLFEEVAALRPDVISIIHPHSAVPLGSHFDIQSAERYLTDLSEFGDLVTKTAWSASIQLAQRIRERAEDHGFPSRLYGEDALSYDVSIPMEFYPRRAGRTSLLPLTTSPLLDHQTHVHWGSLLAEEFHASRERVVVLASAELSSHASDAAQGGMRPEGIRFDHDVLTMLKRDDRDRRLMGIPATLIELAEPCGFLPLLVLSGILKRKRMLMKKISYEHPFGIGLYIATFHNA